MVNSTDTRNFIDLQEIARQFTRNQHVRDKIESTGEAVYITVAQLKGVESRLAVLGDECALIRISGEQTEQSEQKFYSNTLTVYLDDDGKPAVFDSQFKQLENFKFLKYETGFVGYQDISIGDTQFRINLSRSSAYSEDLRLPEKERKIGIKKGMGVPAPKLLASVPHPTVPLRDLEDGLIYKVLKKTGKDTRYERVRGRYLIQDPSGEEFEVVGNEDLDSLTEQKGYPCEFQIVDRIPYKEGYIIKLTSPEVASFANLVV